MTVTQLRKNIYQILKKIAESGQDIIIESKGRRFRISSMDNCGKLEKLSKKPKRKAFIGNSDEIVEMDWSSEWNQDSI